jgi:hypothetical protein
MNFRVTMLSERRQEKILKKEIRMTVENAFVVA